MGGNNMMGSSVLNSWDIKDLCAQLYDEVISKTHFGHLGFMV